MINYDNLTEEIENILYSIQNKSGDKHLFTPELCSEVTEEIIKEIKNKSGESGQLETIVSVPIDAHGKKLKWRKEPPEEHGWWWILFPSCNPEIAQVISDGEHFLIFYNHHLYTFENDSKYLSDCLWAGPICLPID